MQNLSDRASFGGKSSAKDVHMQKIRALYGKAPNILGQMFGNYTLRTKKKGNLGRFFRAIFDPANKSAMHAVQHELDMLNSQMKAADDPLADKQAHSVSR